MADRPSSSALQGSVRVHGRRGTLVSRWKVRRIRVGEGLLLRAFRLHALADAPTAFGSTWAREQAFAEEVWHQRAADGAAGIERVTVVAERGGPWVGMASGLA